MPQTPMITRREWLRNMFGSAAALVVADAVAARALLALEPRVRMTVFRSPTCGCCKSWIAHVRSAGFAVTEHEVSDAQLAQVKAKAGIPEALQSCHTATVGDYTVEGHVPADVIGKALREKPAGSLLAVPGMPVGAPGMEMGTRKDRYDVILYDRRTRRSRVYASR